MSLSKVLASLTAFAVSGVATAGFHSYNPLLITDDGVTGHISGNIGDVYNSVDATERFSCSIEADSTSFAATLSCSASNPMMGFADCTSTASQLINVVNGIHQDSFVSVTYSIATGECLTVTVQHGSKAPPEAVIAWPHATQISVRPLANSGRLGALVIDDLERFHNPHAQIWTGRPGSEKVCLAFSESVVEPNRRYGRAVQQSHQ